MPINILFEDQFLLVIDKPAGIIVNRAESVKEPTIQDWAEKKIEAQSLKFTVEKNDFINRTGIVHRLDKETSGCLIIAKDPDTFSQLQQAFKDRLVKKTYIALVHGNLVPETGEIKAPVGRLPWNRERFGIVPGGKEAATKYKRIKNYELRIKNKKEILSLVELYPESGRTHQIRVHLKYINHPIVGDYLYAGRKTQRADRMWCPRVFLHAAKIAFNHPQTKQELTVESPLPLELTQVLEAVEKTRT